MRTTFLIAALVASAGLAPAQHTLLIVGDGDKTLAVDAPELDLMINDEIYSVTPVIGSPYTARSFLPISLQDHYIGDLDNDGRYVEVSDEGPFGSSNAIDEIFVKAGTLGPVTPRDVFFSVEDANVVGGILQSDVVRYMAQGVREVFMTEAQLITATGVTVTLTNTINLDALCQTAGGDLFFSVSDAETMTLGAVADGDLLHIPASAITYDGAGNVTAITANSAIRVATEAQVLAMITASGIRQASGAVIGTLFELAGLEIDPNGGTWVSPVDLLNYPNLLFCWNDASNDGGIVATAGGGTIAVINGVPMGSASGTWGDQVGQLPTATGTNGLNGLALIPQQAPVFSLMNFPRNLHTPGTAPGKTVVQLQASAGTPNGFTIMAWSVEASIPGGTFPAFPAPAPFVGELGMSAPIIIGLFFNDPLGNSQTNLMVLEMTVLTGVQLAAQALDFTSSTLSTPTGQSFF